jgi:hypothetical protein
MIDDKLRKEFPVDLGLLDGVIRRSKLEESEWSNSLQKAVEYVRNYYFFHWELEFPDAFTDKRRGFDVVVMNPPWDAVRPYDNDFFSEYNPTFRKIKKKDDKARLKSALLRDPIISSKYEGYLKKMYDKLTFFKTSGQYGKRGSKGIAFDSWALFLERGMNLLAEGGTLSVLIPSGIVNNEGAKELRKILLKKRIRHFYEFENKKGIFPDIHKSIKFVLIVADNVPPVEEFQAAFYLYDITALEDKAEREKFIKLTSQFIKLVSPTTLSIPEIRSKKDILIFEKLYRLHPLILTGIDDAIKLILIKKQFKGHC